MEATANEIVAGVDIDDEIRELYEDPRGYTYNEIARMLGVSPTRVQKRVRAMAGRGEINRNRGKGFRPEPQPPLSFSQPL